MSKYILVCLCLLAIGCSNQEQSKFQGKTMSTWSNQLADTDAQTRTQAVTALATMTLTDYRALDALLRGVTLDGFRDNYGIFESLGKQLSSKDHDAIMVLVETIDATCSSENNGQEARYLAAYTILNEMEGRGYPAIDGLLQSFGQASDKYEPAEYGSKKSRILALVDTILGGDRDDGSTLSPEIADELMAICSMMVTSPDRDLRARAVELGGSYGADGARKVGALVKYLNDPDADQGRGTNIRSRAAYWISYTGPDAKSALPALEQALEIEQNADVVKHLENAIERISGSGY